MGNRSLLQAFNEVAIGKASCRDARLAYERAEGDIQRNGETMREEREFQILRFSGTWSDGTAFAVQSDRLLPEADIMQAARAAAMTMLESRETPQ